VLHPHTHKIFFLFVWTHLLALGFLGHLVYSHRHEHLGAATAQRRSGLDDSLRQNSQGIVEGSVSLLEELHGGPSQHDCACLTSLAAREADQLESSGNTR